MREYLTELREPFDGDRWCGPIVKAESLDAAKPMMADSPYEVIGELIMTVDGRDDIDRYVSRGGKLIVH